ncbi:Beta carbonic anhydrase [Seminavis robusta]|uniref:Carbonic anhydrase n=1 Tax=Seminavis robusta TaxID=568900 RepID=A0A9N8DNS6_9STRA|nr:Beta carbonic anhydrase [Seminavis robusta]|eukprot:Sro241_g096440.1 Beta carbonic anhydrase (312) ;mRNA; r:63010-63945
MSSSNHNNLAETALIAGVAAAISAFVVHRLISKDNSPPYPYPATFLQSGRTLTGTEETTVLQSRGWSMEEALSKAKEGSQKAKEKAPLQVLLSLQKGNSRFWTGAASRPEVSAFERRALIKQQFPSTAVLGCSDSRVPVEIVFDQGLGDMFVVRVAGNCLGPTTCASLEYAIHHLQVKVVLVMGHEGCGAIQAARLPLEKIQNESKSLSEILQKIKAGLQDDHLSNIVDARARDRELVAMNVRNQLQQLVQDPQIMDKVNGGNLIIVGAFYEISSGIVDFFMQVSKPNGSMKPSTGVQSRYDPETKEIIFA